jgi:sugar phosphate isomerase/epimerase
MQRREFLQTSVIAAAAVGVAPHVLGGEGPATKPARDPFRGLKVGIASYTYRKFTLDQAIAMTQEAGLKYINLKEAHLLLKSTREERQAAHKKLTDAGLTLMGGGVIYLNTDTTTEDDIRAAFDYVRDAGMPMMVCSPAPRLMDIVEKFVKEYDLRVTINNRGPGDKYFASAYDVYRLVKDRDARLGICLDTGHTVRMGEDPVQVMRECGERVHDLHVKDVTLSKPEGKSTEIGLGVVDMVAFFRTLLERKFAYHVGLECDASETNPQPDVLRSVAYLRGILAAI